MPITPEQAAALEAEDRYVRAQVQLYAWLERAEQHQAAADYAAAPEQRTDGWERIADTHRADADRALRFAHAWAEAAFALVPPPRPLDLIVGADQAVRDSFAKADTRRGGPDFIIEANLPQLSDNDSDDEPAPPTYSRQAMRRWEDAQRYRRDATPRRY